MKSSPCGRPTGQPVEELAGARDHARSWQAALNSDVAVAVMIAVVLKWRAFFVG